MIRFTKTVEPAAADPAKVEKDRADPKAKPATATKKRPAPASTKPAGDDDKLL
ncbi:MAG: hypothetical protein ACOH2J_00210 [Allorhizobium sp.]